jgi:YkoY family integral membrane protein
MFDQTFSPGDLATIAVLVLLEGLLSLDNALVLGILSRRVDKSKRTRVLSYGLIGALGFRIIAVSLAAFLIQWSIIRFIGGAYLMWVSMKYFLGAHDKKFAPHLPPVHSGFWATVLAIELTDIAFAVDSVLAAVALVGPAPASSQGHIHPKLWVIVTGGMLGAILMRFAAALFARLLEKFPHLNRSAYLLVLLIGLKLIADWAVNSPAHPRALNFEDMARPEFWIFWILMAVCLLMGFVPSRGTEARRHEGTK